MSPDIGERLGEVRARVEAAALRSGRDPSEVTVVAVSKSMDAGAVRLAAACGQRDFGENRPQEGAVKYKEVSDEDLRWHFVGRIQRNKVRQVLEFAVVLHSVDRAGLALEVDRRAGSRVDVLVQVNVSGEESKAGVDPRDLHGLLASMAGCERLAPVGLMTMAPRAAGAEDSRPFFRRLRELRDAAAREFPEMAIHHLSMGMSQDYEVAVEEGATMVRIGEAIFGPRQPQNGPDGAAAPGRTASRAGG